MSDRPTLGTPPDTAAAGLAVTDAARRFRAALQTHAPDLRLPGLQRFPTAACGDASRLLRQYLHDLGLGPWAVVSARSHDNASSHAWLARNGVTLDITADQFSADMPPVIITGSSAWHDAWPQQDVHTWGVGIDYYSPDSGAADDYALLVAAASSC